MKLALFLLAAWTAVAANRPNLPYTFEKNTGQAPATVKFLARGEGYGLYLTENDAVLTLQRGPDTQQVVRMSLDGSLPPAKIEGVGQSKQITNYFLGNDPKQWQVNVPHFDGVRYAGVYSGVDLIYHSQASELEYDFVVAPGASVDTIRMRFSGMQTIRISPAGALELVLGGRKLVHQAPVAYQEVNGRRRRVRAAYKLLGDDQVRFVVGGYDRTLPLVIDPVVLYSTFLGGDRTESVNAIAVDPMGNTYVTGETTSTNFPAVGTQIIQQQGAVVYSFVTKYNAAGTEILYSTLLGGGSNTRGYAIAADAAGNAYIGGVTGAKNFPVVNPVQATHGGLNIGFVTKLNPLGNAVLFSTYIGGDRNDEVRALALGRSGSIHVAGRVTSSQYPAVNAIQPAFGGNADAFVAVYNAPDYRLRFNTPLGKTGFEEAYAVAVDADEATYITGAAQTAGMATEGAFQSVVRSPNDAFAAKISPTGTQLEWWTYYGGRGDDKGEAIALDSVNNVLIGGSATSDNLPIVAGKAFQPALRGDVDAFLAKFSNGGRDLLRATYLGSSATRTGVTEVVNRIAIDPSGGVVIAGVSNGADFPTVRPIQEYGGGISDGFVARFDDIVSTLAFSTHIGGSAADQVLGMAVDSGGGVHLAGDTLSSNFPLKNAIRTTFASSTEGFVSHICDPFLIASSTSLFFTYEVGKTVPNAQSLQLSACAQILVVAQAAPSWLITDPVNAITNTAMNVRVQPQGMSPGTYTGEVRLVAADAVNSPVTVSVTLKVNGPPPVATSAGIVNAATAQGGAIAPGELVVIYGQNLGPAGLAGFEVDTLGRMGANLRETRVYFDGVQGPMVYTSSGQISTIVPYAVEGKATVQVEVEYMGVRSAPVTMAVAPTSPGIFTANASGTGQGSILNQDYGINSASNPADRGSIVAIYATGEGVTDPRSFDGVFANEALPKPIAPVSVTIGGQNAEVLYAGAAPGLVAGVLQVNVRIPEGTPSGAAEVLLKIGSATSRTGVTVAVK